MQLHTIMSVGFIPCVLCFSAAAMGPGDSPKTPLASLSIAASPLREGVPVGGPVVIKVTLANKGPSDLRVDLGTDGTEAFRFDVLDAREQAVCNSEHHSTPGLSRLGKVTIGAGQSVERRLVLNEWCATPQQPGNYTVITYMRVSQEEKTAKCALSVGSANVQELEKTFRELASAAVGDKDFAERIFAARLLTGTNSPAAVGAITEILNRSTEPDFKIRAIRALGRIQTLEAVNVLISTAQARTDSDSNISSVAVAEIKRVHDSTGDPTIRVMCQPFSNVDHRSVPSTKD